MNKIPSQSENPNGFHARYKIEKWVKSDFFNGEFVAAPTDPGSEYFVMRLDTGGKDLEHIKACRIGIHAYADAIQHHLPELSKDLKERYPLL